MRNRSRTRYERELIKVLREELGENWFGHRGAHSDGVDVLMFHSTETNPILFCGIRFEVKSKNQPFPFYLDKREREQYDSYKSILDLYGVETVYAFRKVGGRGKQWWFCNSSDFGITKNGNVCVRQENATPMQEFITSVKAINGN